MPAAFDPLRVLRTLKAHDVRFVVIGGVAAWIQGASIVTADLDIVFECTDENANRLSLALRELGAIYRHQLGRRIEPDAAGLLSTSGGGHHLFETEAGDVDALRKSGEYDFERLEPRAVTFAIEDVEAQFATLEDVIEMKKAAGRDKDRAALPVLEAALEEQD